MKSFKLISLLAAVSITLVACGGAAPSPTAAPVAPAATTAPVATEAPKPTEAPTVAAATQVMTATTAMTDTTAMTGTMAMTDTTAMTGTAAMTGTMAMTGTAATTGTMAMTGVSAGKELDEAMTGKYKGTKVTVDGAFTGDDAKKFDSTLADFKAKTGIDIVYIGSKEFEKEISVAVDGGNAPDIADFPQPGLMARFAAQGKLVDVSTHISPDWLKANYNQSWLDMATVPNKDGKPIMAGVWERVNAKSLVWYPKKAFDAANYKVPTTWAELQALQATIIADGDTPWCIGIESGAATGWAATDWMEEFMLRTTSLENYDKWTKGELKFNSPEVKAAATAVGKIWFDDKMVYGGRKSIASTNFGDAPKPMFDKDGPKCWLHKQGNFITTFFPKEMKAGEDYDFFYLPGIDEKYGKPVLVAGDLMSQFNDRPEVRAVMQLFTKGEHLKTWMQQNGAIAPQRDADLSWYGSAIDKGVAKIIQDATAVRFDGSDLMPGEVGAGSFWKAMTDWVSGSVELDKALDEIDKSWPKK